MIHFTTAACEKFDEVISGAGEDYAGVKISAERLGTHTFKYQLNLIRQTDVKPTDEVLNVGSFQAVVDADSKEWLSDATVDFSTKPQGSGFEIDNPAAKVEWSDPIAQKVQKVLDESVMPALMSHGGFCELVEVKADTAYVQLGGGCHGCPGARATMKYGVEAIIVRDVPEISRVVDATDHAGQEGSCEHSN